eukprot:scaffold4738_cov61-Cyclotella_meneghiniana.AAC.4
MVLNRACSAIMKGGTTLSNMSGGGGAYLPFRGSRLKTIDAFFGLFVIYPLSNAKGKVQETITAGTNELHIVINITP